MHMQHSDSDTDAMSVASAIGEDGEEDVFAAAAILPDADGDGIFDLPASPMPGEGTADLGGFDEGGEEGGEEGDGDGEGSGDDGSGEGSGEESEERQAAMVAQLREALLARGYEMRDAPARPAQLPSFDIAGFAQRLASCPPRSVVVLCGAGISVSAGIPDFRSARPRSGIRVHVSQLAPERTRIPPYSVVFRCMHSILLRCTHAVLSKTLHNTAFVP